MNFLIAWDTNDALKKRKKLTLALYCPLMFRIDGDFVVAALC
jgi:hypothetical protein